MTPRHLLTVLLALLGPHTALAQESVRSAVMVADLTAADGSAVVKVEYVLDGVTRAGAMDASVLDFGDATASDVRSGVEGLPAALRLLQGAAHGTELRMEAGEEPGTARVVASYRVSSPVRVGSGRMRGHVPVLSVDRAPLEAQPGLFRAELRLPPDWIVTEGFPTGLRPTGEPGVYEASLSVVPAVVSFRARSGGGWRPGLPLVLDLLAGVTLLGFSVVGWRHLREVAS